MSTTTLFALFLLSAFTLYPTSTTAQYVLDVDGNPVQNRRGSYYISPAIWAYGGGVEPATMGNETCPLSVVVTRSELDYGKPVTFWSIVFSPYLLEGDRVQIRFIGVPTCAPAPSEWTLVKGLPEGQAVKLTGYKNIETGLFAIKEVNYKLHFYKLVFCTSERAHSCKAIGVSTDGDGNKLLVVDDNNPLVFVIMKVPSSSHGKLRTVSSS